MVAHNAGQQQQPSVAKRKTGVITKILSRGTALAAAIMMMFSLAVSEASGHGGGGGSPWDPWDPWGQTEDPIENPPLKSDCGKDGQKVAIAVDLSGSMEGQGLETMKKAAIAYVNALAGTDAQMALFTFESQSPAQGANNANRPLTSLKDPQNVTQMINWIKGLSAKGGTSWSAPLSEIAKYPATFDFVLFLTDGDPTDDLDKTVASANSVKKQGTRIIVVYASDRSATSERIENIKSISGPVTNNSDVTKNDYFTLDWGHVEALLKSLSEMCVPQKVNVTWVDDEANGTAVTPKSGAKTVLTGTSGSSVGFTEQDARDGIPDGYEYKSIDNVATFDNDLKVDQSIVVHVVHKRTQSEVTTTRTIEYKGAGAKTPPAHVQSITWKVTKDLATGEMTYTTDADGYPAVTTPTVPGHRTDVAEVPAAKVTSPMTTQPQSSTVVVTYTPITADASKSTIQLDKATQTTGSTVKATVTVLDDLGQPLQGQEVVVSVSGNATFGAAGQTPVQSTTCTTDNNGTCSVDLTDAKAEKVLVSAVVNGAPVGGNGDPSKSSPREVIFTPSDFSHTRSTFEVSPVADVKDKGSWVSVSKGSSYYTGTLTAMDSNGNPLPDLALADIVFTSGKDVTITSVVNKGDGTYTVQFSSTVAASDPVAQVTYKNIQVGTAKPIPFKGGAPSVNPVCGPGKTGTNVSVNPPSTTVGETSTVSALVTDEFCNPLPGTDVSFSLKPGSSGQLGTVKVTTDEHGRATTTVTDDVPEKVGVNADIDQGRLPGSPAEVAFVRGSVDGKNSTVAVSPDRQAAGSPVTVTVTVKDAKGNPISGLTAADVVVTGTASGLPDLAMTGFQEVAPGVYTFTTTSKLVGEFEVRATVTGTALSDKPHVVFYAAGVCVANANPVDPKNLTRFEMVANDQLADGTAKDSAKVYAYDCNGNPVGNASVVVTDKSTGTLSGMLKPATQTVKTGADGTAMVEWTSTKAGTFTAEGLIDGLRPATGVMSQIRFTTGAADPGKSELRVTPVSPIQVGNSYTAEATVRDATGNPVRDATVSFRLDPTSPATLSSDTCTTGALGTCQVNVRSELVTEVNIHATLPKNGQPVGIGGSPQKVGFIAGSVCVTNCTPVDKTHLTRVEVVTDGAEANGMASNLARAWAFDTYGNPVANAQVTSTTTDSTLTTVTPIPATGKDGASLVEYRSTVAGPHPAAVTIAGLVPVAATSMDGTVTKDGSITVNFGSGTASAARTSLSIDPKVSQEVGSVFTVTAHVKDANGNIVSGAVVTFPEVANLGFSAASCVSRSDGTCEVTVSSKLVGTYTVSARLGVQPVSNTVNAVFTVGELCVTDCEPVVKDNITRVVVTRDGQEANGVARDVATVYAYDRFGNPRVGETVTSAPAAGETTLTVAPDIAQTSADGTTTVWYTSTVTGAHRADVRVGGKVPQGSPVTVNFGSGAGDVSRSSWTVSPRGPLTVGEGTDSQYTATATVKDAHGNAVEGAVVSFGIDPAHPVFTPGTSCLTNKQGVCSVKVHSTVSGTYSLTASIAAGPIMNAETKAPAASIAWRADKVCANGCDPVNPELPSQMRTRVEKTVDGQTADGNAKNVVTVWAFDKWGNPVEGALVQSTSKNPALNVQTGIAAIGKDGSSTVWYTSMTAGSYLVEVSVDGDTPVGSPVTMSFVAGEVCVIENGCEPVGPGTDPSRQTRAEVTLNDQRVNGTDVITVWAYDKTGNPVEGVGFEIRTKNPVKLGELGEGTAKVVSGSTGSAIVNATSAVGGAYEAKAFIGSVELVKHGSPMELRFLAAPVITSPKDGALTKDDPLKVVGTGQIPGNTVVVSEGGKEVCRGTVGSDFTWGCEVSLKDGEHTLVAVETTPDGKTSDPSKPVTVGVDTVAPGVPEITKPGDGSLVGTGTPEVSGTGQEPGNKVTVTDGGNTVCTAVVQDDKTWKCTPDKPLTEGEHTLVAKETDKTGNVSDPSKPVGIVVDTVAPGVPEITKPGDGSLVGTGTPEISGTGQEPGNKVTVTDGGNTVCTTVVQDDKTWVCKPDKPLTEGEHTLVAKETDKTGNVSDPSKPVGIVVDTVAPKVPEITKPGDGSLVGTGTPEVSGTGQEPGNKVDVTDGGNTVCTAVVQDDKTWKCTPDKPLAEGEHTLVAKETDKTGNVSDPSKQVTVEVDTVAPGVPEITKPGDGSLIGTGTPEVSGTGQEPGNKVEVTDGGNTVCTATVQDDKTWVCKPDKPLTEGEHTLVAKETDKTGNVSDPSKPVGIIVDTVAPGVPEITKPGDGSLIGTGTPEVSGTGQEPGNKVEVTDGGNTVCTAVVQDDKTWKCTPDKPLTEGEHTLVAKETDKTGNVSDPSKPVGIVVDTVAPKVPEITKPGDGSLVGTGTPEVSGTGQEPGNKVTVTDGGNTVCTTVVQEDKTWVCKPDKPLTEGEHTLVAKETDKTGNVSDPSKQVTVEVDTVPPGVPVVDPGNGSKVTGTTEPGTTVTVTDENGKKVEGCVEVQPDQDGRFSCKPTTPLPPGTSVEVTAKDKAGNGSDPKTVVVASLVIEVAHESRNPGETQVVTGRNFAPGEKVCLTLDDKSVGVECRVAGPDGTVTFTFTVPKSISSGSHTVTLTSDSEFVSGAFKVPARPIVQTGGVAVRQHS